MMKNITLVLVLLLVGFALATAQNNKRKPGDLLQFSGVVVSGDSLQPVPFTAITVKGTYRGTLSDYYGFFSFVAQEGDTIEFSVLGFQKSTYILPDSLEGSRYSIIQVLNQDTVLLPTTVIYPWPTKEQIYEYFLKAPVPDDDLERARKNLAQEPIVDMALTVPMDATMNYRNAMSQYNTRLYNAGQIPMNNLLNPIAWAKFVQAWKKGEFKKKTTR
jgi:hypothetical protein